MLKKSASLGRIEISRCVRQFCSAKQRAIFDEKVDTLNLKLPDEVESRLTRICKMAEMSTTDRVLDVGAGTGRLIPHIQAQGVNDILAIDVSPNMVNELKERFSNPPVLGNDSAVRTWLGPYSELPKHLGRADIIFMNAVFGNLPDPLEALLHSTLLLNPGGKVVISHPLGREWHTALHERDPVMVPNLLPDLPMLDRLLHGLPLELRAFVDEPDLYCAIVSIPPGYSFAAAPLRLQGTVVAGFGRGSKQMGIPTANLSPAAVEEALQPHPKGVYFGWAQLRRDGEEAVAPMVMNYGQRPSIEDGWHTTVEVHIMREYDGDFHGEEVRAVVTGFLRPELRFKSLACLVDRIHHDISLARVHLLHPKSQAFQQDPLFS